MGNCERRYTVLSMLPNVGKNTMLRFWRREDFPEAWPSPCHFFHKGFKTYILVHGDDFFIVGRRKGRKHVLSLLRCAHELSKVVTLGLESSQSRTVSFLGRTLTLRQCRIEYEPDEQHVSRALKALGLTVLRVWRLLEPTTWVAQSKPNQ